MFESSHPDKAAGSINLAAFYLVWFPFRDIDGRLNVQKLYAERIYVGDTPAILDRVRTFPSKFQTELTESDMENYSSGIVQAKRKIRFVNESKDKINLSLRGIYIKGDVMFFQFKAANNSNIDYDVDLFKFYVRDKARIKRTASQEVEVKPIYVYGNNKKIKGKSSTDLVYVLQKFTIPESKYLDVEMFEQNGGRNIDMNIKNKTIVNARLLP